MGCVLCNVCVCEQTCGHISRYLGAVYDYTSNIMYNKYINVEIIPPHLNKTYMVPEFKSVVIKLNVPQKRQDNKNWAHWKIHKIFTLLPHIHYTYIIYKYIPSKSVLYQKKTYKYVEIYCTVMYDTYIIHTLHTKCI